MCVQYPENYIPIAATNETKQPKRKRTLQETDIEDNEQSESNGAENVSLENVDDKNHTEKKVKIQYELEKEAEILIMADKANKKYWDDCKELLGKGKKVRIHLKPFLNAI